MPVTLPPGRARLATRPSLTGSVPLPKTMGIVVVAAFGERRGSVADNDRDLTANEIGRQCRQTIDLVLGPAELDGDVLALDEAGFLQPIAECRDKRRQRIR
jgi:hypothetical protein